MIEYKCPFNYVGSKSQILPVLIDLFDEYKDLKFVDLFAGGFSVGLNVKNLDVIYNDINTDLVELMREIYDTEYEVFEKRIVELIERYDLNKFNNKGYLKLRSDFNTSRDTYLFCLLIFYSFNHQIRYNQSNGFNTPFGKNRSSYNLRTKVNLKKFFELMASKKIEFQSKNFSDVVIKSNMIFYADPPYLVSVGSYNDGKRGVSFWDNKKEKELYEYLDLLNQKNVKFVLSNMLSKGDFTNTILDEWRTKYNTVFVDTKYKNYQRNNVKTQEIIVKNF